MDNIGSKKNTRAAALSVTAFLVLVIAACLLYLLVLDKSPQDYVAEIYQDGCLIYTIPLNSAQSTYTLEMEGKDGGHNRIEIRQDSIGITWADCPDKLCVRQGYIHNASIPLTCLPNKLVIRLNPVRESISDAVPDAVTY